jgi:hypothetical protein
MVMPEANEGAVNMTVKSMKSISAAQATSERRAGMMLDNELMDGRIE